MGLRSTHLQETASALENEKATMVLSMKTMTDYLVEFGAEKVPHTRKTYLGHAVSVYQDMKAWQAEDELCRAAMFHSIYGTEGFQTLTLPLDRREELRTLIGERAEKLVYVNCAMDRESFYGQVDQYQDDYQIKDRLAGGTIDLSHVEFEDLIRLHLCDFLEQCERTDHWHYKRETMRVMSERLGGAAREAYEATFAREPRSD